MLLQLEVVAVIEASVLFPVDKSLKCLLVSS